MTWWMDLQEYQNEAKFFLDSPDNEHEFILGVLALGSTGESGEVAEIIKKHLGHKHDLDIDAVTKELGDVLWYLAAIATKLNISLDYVAKENIKKLRERYPNGFNSEDSKNRKS